MQLGRPLFQRASQLPGDTSYGALLPRELLMISLAAQFFCCCCLSCCGGVRQACGPNGQHAGGSSGSTSSTLCKAPTLPKHISTIPGARTPSRPTEVEGRQGLTAAAHLAPFSSRQRRTPCQCSTLRPLALLSVPSRRVSMNKPRMGAQACPQCEWVATRKLRAGQPCDSNLESNLMNFQLPNKQNMHVFPAGGCLAALGAELLCLLTDKRRPGHVSDPFE